MRRAIRQQLQRSRLSCIFAIELERAFRLLRNIRQIGHRRLHAKRHFILRDAHLRFGIGDLFVLHMIQFAHSIQHAAADFSWHAVRIVDIQNRVATRTKSYSRILAREKARTPQTGGNCLNIRLRIRMGCVQNHKRGQILVHAAKAVSDPRADARLPAIINPVWRNVMAGS